MWWQIPIALGVGTGVGVGIRGGNLYEVVGWTALTTGLTTAAGSGSFWRGAWGLSNWVRVGAPLASGGRAVVATGAAAGGMGVGTAVAAVGAGTVLGAATGTGIVAVAENQGVVYEGATGDVLDLYLPGGAGASEWISTVGPALVQQSEIQTTRKAKQSIGQKGTEAALTVLLGPIWGPTYSFFRR